MSVQPMSGAGADVDVEIGATVHQLMFRARVSQTALARVLGISQSVLSRKLRGIVTWTAADIVKAAYALDVKPDDLLPAFELVAPATGLEPVTCRFGIRAGDELAARRALKERRRHWPRRDRREDADRGRFPHPFAPHAPRPIAALA